MWGCRWRAASSATCPAGWGPKRTSPPGSHASGRSGAASRASSSRATTSAGAASSASTGPSSPTASRTTTTLPAPPSRACSTPIARPGWTTGTSPRERWARRRSAISDSSASVSATRSGGSRPAGSGARPQPLEELDLPGVVDVVVGRAEDEVAHRPLGSLGDGLQVLVPEGGHGRAQVAVRLLQEAQVGLPGRLADLPFRTGEPVAPRQRKADLRPQPVEDGILPVGRVNGELPDVVPLRGRPPRRRLRRDAAQRALEDRPVPGLVVVARVEGAEEDLDAGIAHSYFP